MDHCTLQVLKIHIHMENAGSEGPLKLPFFLLPNLVLGRSLKAVSSKIIHPRHALPRAAPYGSCCAADGSIDCIFCAKRRPDSPSEAPPLVQNHPRTRTVFSSMGVSN